MILSQVVREFLFLLFAFLDLEFTKRRLAEVGVDKELNPLIRLLIKKLGLTWGTTIGILIPTGILASLGWYNPNLLSFMLGVRGLLFLLQLQTRS